jgi:hypothetical protein
MRRPPDNYGSINRRLNFNDLDFVVNTNTSLDNSILGIDQSIARPPDIGRTNPDLN